MSDATNPESAVMTFFPGIFKQVVLGIFPAMDLGSVETVAATQSENARRTQNHAFPSRGTPESIGMLSVPLPRPLRCRIPDHWDVAEMFARSVRQRCDCARNHREQDQQRRTSADNLRRVTHQRTAQKRQKRLKRRISQLPSQVLRPIHRERGSFLPLGR